MFGESRAWAWISKEETAKKEGLLKFSLLGWARRARGQFFCGGKSEQDGFPLNTFIAIL
jgi:hypothetical protein